MVSNRLPPAHTTCLQPVAKPRASSSLRPSNSLDTTHLAAASTSPRPSTRASSGSGAESVWTPPLLALHPPVAVLIHLLPSATSASGSPTSAGRPPYSCSQPPRHKFSRALSSFTCAAAATAIRGTVLSRAFVHHRDVKIKLKEEQPSVSRGCICCRRHSRAASAARLSRHTALWSQHLNPILQVSSHRPWNLLASSRTYLQPVLCYRW